MKKITDTQLSDFFANYPLYSKLLAVENLNTYQSKAFLDNLSFSNRPFKYKCPVEGELQTFKTEIQPSKLFVPMPSFLNDDPHKLPPTFDIITEKLDIVIHVQGICQSCSKKIDFLIKAFSDKKWSERVGGLNIFIQKIGQFPSFEIELNNDLKKYLSDEDKSNYKKALVCLSISYGIGSYSYLRRVIENEIKRIIKDISELEFEGAEYVKSAIETYNKDFQMSKLIDVVNTYLPLSLKELGDNPIRLLYEQLSGGIHDFTDEECVKKARDIDTLLNYVIKKVYEEKYQLNDVKKAMKNLRGK